MLYHSMPYIIPRLRNYYSIALALFDGLDIFGNFLKKTDISGTLCACSNTLTVLNINIILSLLLLINMT